MNLFRGDLGKERVNQTVSIDRSLKVRDAEDGIFGIDHTDLSNDCLTSLSQRGGVEIAWNDHIA